MSQERRCGHCNKVLESPLRCGQCKAVFYCSADHQRADWKRHKSTCRKAPSSSPIVDGGGQHPPPTTAAKGPAPQTPTAASRTAKPSAPIKESRRVERVKYLLEPTAPGPSSPKPLMCSVCELVMEWDPAHVASETADVCEQFIGHLAIVHPAVVGYMLHQYEGVAKLPFECLSRGTTEAARYVYKYRLVARDEDLQVYKSVLHVLTEVVATRHRKGAVAMSKKRQGVKPEAMHDKEWFTWDPLVPPSKDGVPRLEKIAREGMVVKVAPRHPDASIHILGCNVSPNDGSGTADIYWHGTFGSPPDQSTSCHVYYYTTQLGESWFPEMLREGDVVLLYPGIHDASQWCTQSIRLPVEIYGVNGPREEIILRCGRPDRPPLASARSNHASMQGTNVTLSFQTGIASSRAFVMSGFTISGGGTHGSLTLDIARTVGGRPVQLYMHSCVIRCEGGPGIVVGNGCKVALYQCRVQDSACEGLRVESGASACIDSCTICRNGRGVPSAQVGGVIRGEHPGIALERGSTLVLRDSRVCQNAGHGLQEAASAVGKDGSKQAVVTFEGAWRVESNGLCTKRCPSMLGIGPCPHHSPESNIAKTIRQRDQRHGEESYVECL